MINFQASVVIARPVAEVFAFVACLDNISRWVSGSVARKVSPEPMGEGTLFEESSGPRRKFLMKVANYHENKGFHTQSVSGPLSLKVQGQLEFESVPEGTHFRLSHQITLPWWLCPLQPLLAWKARRETNEAMLTLKKILESGAIR